MAIVRKVFRLDGMYCSPCAVSAGMMLKAVQGVKSARTDYATRSAEVKYDDTQVDLARMNQALKGLGYRLEEGTYSPSPSPPVPNAPRPGA